MFKLNSLRIGYATYTANVLCNLLYISGWDDDYEHTTSAWAVIYNYCDCAKASNVEMKEL